MEYAIVYLLRKEAGNYHKLLVRKLAKRFNENYLISSPIPSHATLKYPFKAKRLEEIENMLKKFCKKQSPAKIKIRKVKHFREQIIYLDLEFSRKALMIYRDLKKQLRHISWLIWRAHDKLENKFHSTLIYGNSPKTFKRIWKYVSNLKPTFDIELDNISILIKKRKYWKLFKTYEITNR